MNMSLTIEVTQCMNETFTVKSVKLNMSLNSRLTLQLPYIRLILGHEEVCAPFSHSD